MRISDWSSDVCSSDLAGERGVAAEGSLNQATFIVGTGSDFEFVTCDVQRSVRPAEFTAVILQFLRLDTDARRPCTDRGSTLGEVDPVLSSEERRVGTEWVSTCRSRWSTAH